MIQFQDKHRLVTHTNVTLRVLTEVYILLVQILNDFCFNVHLIRCHRSLARAETNCHYSTTGNNYEIIEVIDLTVRHDNSYSNFQVPELYLIYCR